MAAVQVGVIKDRVGQKLRDILVERMTPRGEPLEPRYNLSVKLTESMISLGYQRDTTATLGEMRASAVFILTSVDQKISISGQSQATVSVDYLGPRYGSVAAERDAEDRAVSQLADGIVTQIAAFLEDPHARARQEAAPVLQPILPPSRGAGPLVPEPAPADVLPVQGMTTRPVP
jgi:LPS-assembly lipoprotein